MDLEWEEENMEENEKDDDDENKPKDSDLTTLLPPDGSISTTNKYKWI